MTPDRVRGRLWAQRLKRVFHLDIETCRHGGGMVKIIACIEDPAVIQTTAWMQEDEPRREQLPKILDHLAAKATAEDIQKLPESRAPPPAVAFN